MKINLDVTNQALYPPKEAIILWDKYEVGYFVSVDIYIFKPLIF